MSEYKYKIDGFLVGLVRELVAEMDIACEVWEHTFRIWPKNRYVQVVLSRDFSNIHYEFWRDHWALHIEGIDFDNTAQDFYEYLKGEQLTKDGFLVWDAPDGINELRVYKPVDSIEEFIHQFKELYKRVQPCVEDFFFTDDADDDVEEEGGASAIVALTNTPSSAPNAVLNYQKVEAKVKLVSDVLSTQLRIPDYQRPYVWEKSNVIQLLSDIRDSQKAGKSLYRIGSLILHYNDTQGTLDIVDGQQRITTLLLIYKACCARSNKQNIADQCLANLKFNHSESFKHIKENYLYICDWLAKLYNDDFMSLWSYIYNSCEMVQIIVTVLSEAFQMFDTQNGRGKSLEAYNLLKAYHIRAMEQCTKEEKIECDKRWEAATLYDATPTIKDDPNIDVLKQLFDEQLYRSRVWSRNKVALGFNNSKIGEFKGITIDKNHEPAFPYQSQMLLQYLTSKFYTGVIEGVVKMPNRFKSGDSENINPFVTLTQDVVNGKAFFDYTETYTEIYKQLFLNLDTYNLQEFKSFFVSHCLNYDSPQSDTNNPYRFKAKGRACRSGDTYLRELYKSLVFALFDKFGEDGLLQQYKLLYQIVYIQRLLKEKVTYVAVAQLPHEYFKAISRSKDLVELDARLQRIWSILQDNHQDKIKEMRIEKRDVKPKLPHSIVREIINNYQQIG